MFSRSIIRLTLALIIVVASLLLVTSITATAAAPTTDTRPRADLIVNPGESIQAAIDAANDGDTIIIHAGDYTESLTLSKPVSLTGVNSDTTIIHAVAGQRVLTVTGAMISNSVVISGLAFTGGQADQGGGILVASGAKPALQNLAVISNMATYAGGVLAEDLILIDSLIKNNVGGGVATDITTVTGGLFSGNTDYGGLIAESITLSGTRFLGNSSAQGGGLRVNQTATITNAHFADNYSNWEGGGLFAAQNFNSMVRMTNSTFVNNSADSGCGGAYLGGVASIANDRFEHNQGGGLCCYQYSCALDIRDSVFVSNTKDQDYSGGGGVYLNGSALTVTHSLFEGNSAHYLGGGLYSGVGNGSAQLINTDFISNTATGMSGGGGAFFYGTINGGRFERNVSTFSGGGGLFGAGTISGTSFISNSAITAGGFYGSGTIINARFEGNQSSIEDDWLGGGGALATAGGRSTTISQTQFINNFSATRGGAVLAQAANELRIIDSLFINNAAREGTAVGDVSYLSGIGNISLIHTTIADTQLNPTSAVSVLSFTAQLTDTIIANHAIGISNTGGLVTEDYNLFYGNITNTIGVTMGAHSIVGDPRFVDPAHDDYHLAFGSAAIDRGVDAGVYTDLDGNIRPQGAGFDIGAYEYQGPIYRAFLPLLQK